MMLMLMREINKKKQQQEKKQMALPISMMKKMFQGWEQEQEWIKIEWNGVDYGATTTSPSIKQKQQPEEQQHTPSQGRGREKCQGSKKQGQHQQQSRWNLNRIKSIIFGESLPVILPQHHYHTVHYLSLFRGVGSMCVILYCLHQPHNRQRKIILQVFH